MSKEYLPRKEDGYVLCVETLPDGTVTQTKIPYLNQGPGVARRAANFAMASAKHLADGARKATDEEVDERFRKCQKCPLKMFRPQEGNHGKCLHMECGCILGDSTYQGKNKLRWADQACPEGVWGAV